MDKIDCHGDVCEGQKWTHETVRRKRVPEGQCGVLWNNARPHQPGIGRLNVPTIRRQILNLQSARCWDLLMQREKAVG